MFSWVDDSYHIPNLLFLRGRNALNNTVLWNRVFQPWFLWFLPTFPPVYPHLSKHPVIIQTFSCLLKKLHKRPHVSYVSLCVQSLKQVSTKQLLKYLLNKQMNSNAKDTVALMSLHVKGTSRAAKINEWPCQLFNEWVKSWAVFMLDFVGLLWEMNSLMFLLSWTYGSISIPSLLTHSHAAPLISA